jgi:hypothetical protein
MVFGGVHRSHRCIFRYTCGDAGVAEGGALDLHISRDGHRWRLGEGKNRGDHKTHRCDNITHNLQVRGDRIAWHVRGCAVLRVLA